MKIRAPVTVLIGLWFLAPLAWPDRFTNYTVQAVDTLWEIAGRFFGDPLCWPELWQQNPQLRDLHRIFPGDQLIFQLKPNSVQFRLLRIDRVSPQIRVAKRVLPIPVIPLKIIQPFLTEPVLFDESLIHESGQVLGGVKGQQILGKCDPFYVAGLEGADQTDYRLVRLGRIFHDLETDEALGRQVEVLGSATVLTFGDSAIFGFISRLAEIMPDDRLVVAQDPMRAAVLPRRPDRVLRGHILVSRRDSVKPDRWPLSYCRQEVERASSAGHVLNIWRSASTSSQSGTGSLAAVPGEVGGTLVVFRVFEKLSYGLILTASWELQVGDIVTEGGR